MSIPQVSWRRLSSDDAFLTTRAGIIQRVRELLPPEISRATVDEAGVRCRRPFAVVEIQSSPEEKSLLLWLSASKSLSDGQSDSPQSCIISGITLSRMGMKLLPADQVRGLVRGSELEQWLLSSDVSVNGIELLVTGGKLEPLQNSNAGSVSGSPAESASPSGPGKTNGPINEQPSPEQDWPAIVFEEAVDSFFEKARTTLKELSLDPTAARKEFDAAAGDAPSRPSPERFTEEEQRALRERLQTFDATFGDWPWDRIILFREPLPFYRNYDLITIDAPGRDPIKLVVLSRSDDAMPLLMWGSGVDKLREFHRQLQTSGDLRIDRDTAASCLRFVLDFLGGKPSKPNSRAPLETSDRLPKWIEAPLRASVAARWRPITCLGDSDQGTVLAAITGDDDVVLRLIIVRADGFVEDRVQHLLLADPSPEHGRDLREDARAIRAIFAWNMAAAFHEEDFTRALQQVEGQNRQSGRQVWELIRAGQNKGSTRTPEEENFKEKEVSADGYRHIREQLGRLGAGIALPDKPGTPDARLEARELTFYEGYSLYFVEIGTYRYRFVARRDSKPEDGAPLVGLDGKSNAIHWLNERLSARHELRITPKTAPQYLRFFGAHVHAQQGAFAIIESVLDFKWRFQTLETKEALRSLLWPIYTLPTNRGGPITLAALVGYGRELSVALFRVTPDGAVEMIASSLLVSNLPVYPGTYDAQRDAAFVLVKDAD
jgi:hypothetical protein